ncbi:MAG: RDD family protein [Prosthecobacter sp.]
MKYHVARESESLGEFTDLDISAGLRHGQFLPSDLCWTPSMEDWEPLSVRFTSSEREPLAAMPPPLTSTAHLPEAVQNEPLATRPQRLLAWFIDNLCLLPVALLLAHGLGDKAVKVETPSAAMELLMQEIQARPEAFQSAAWALIAVMLINGIMLSLLGQTIGKWITGIRIVMFQTGARAGFVRAVLLRSFVMSVFGNIAYVGAGIQLFDILCIFRADRRCLHDLIADTVVVRMGRS